MGCRIVIHRILSLQDIFYFSNLKELDLTGGTLFNLPQLLYDRNGASSTVGGGSYEPYLAKVSAISSSNMQALKDLLELGLLDKVKYVPNSMGLDELLAPYVADGIVELVTTPDEVLIDTAGLGMENRYHLSGYRCA